MQCARITSLQFCFCLQKKSFLADCSALQLGDDITIKTSDWLKGDATFDQWRAGLDTRSEQSNEELRKRRLVEKFARIWRMKTIKGNKLAYMMSSEYDIIAVHIIIIL